MEKKTFNYEVCDLKLFKIDDMDILLHKILKQVRESLNVEAGTIYIADGDVLKFNVFQNDVMSYEEIYNQHVDLIDSRFPIQENSSYLSVDAYINEKMIIVNDVYSSDSYKLDGVKEYDKKYNYKTHSIITAPIIDPMENKKLGVLQLINKLENKQKVNFNEQDKKVLSIALSLVSLSIFQAQNDFLKLQELNEKLKISNDNLEERVKFEVNQNEKKSAIIYNQSKLASMGEMIGNIAHQWRQPLSGISTIASGLSFKAEYDQTNNIELIDSLNQIVDTTQYLSDTIDDFRNFYRVDKSLESFDLAKNIKQCIVITEATLTHNSISVIIDLDETLEVSGFKNELKQVILNMIQNAKDALIENKEEERFIFITLKKIDNSIVLEIKDNAGGISDDIVDYIFEKDFTTKGEHHGTGIGLHMSKIIIEKSFNGKISVINSKYNYSNKEHKGALFTIELPA